MEKRKDYNLCLIGDNVKNEFLTEIGDQYEIINILENIPQVIRIRLSISEKEELLKNIYVLGIVEDIEWINEGSVGFNDKTITVSAPSSSEVGSNYRSAIHKYMTDGVTTSNPNGLRTVGLKDDFFQPSMVECNYTSQMSGEHVDIVALEGFARSSNIINNYYKSHPEWNHPDTGVTRCIPMNWSQYDSSIIADKNTNQTGTMLTSHGAGVLSVAAGIVGGLAKKSSMRIMYILLPGYPGSGDDFATGCNAIINWHNSKPTNPVTGKKNPTIVNMSMGVIRELLIPISQISSINYRGTTINRPPSDRNSDLNGWRLNDFIQYNLLPLKDNGITSGGGSSVWSLKFASFDTPDGVDMNTFSTVSRSSVQAMIDAGITFIKSAGNTCSTISKYNSDDWDNYITTDNTYNIGYVGWTQESRTTSENYYTHRSIGPEIVSDGITVAAYQASEATPALDPYTTRGPGIDMCGLGRGTWSAFFGGRGFQPGPQTTYAEGNPYGIFSGTSSAAPTVAGVAACILEYQYLTTGSYPDPATLKNLLLGVAKSNRVQNYESIDWDALPSPSATDDTYLQNVTSVYSNQASLLQKGFVGGSTQYATDLLGTTSRGAFLPDFMRTYNPDTGQSTPTPTPSPPSVCIHPTIKGPTGLVSSPPYNYAQSFDKYEGNRGSLGGIYFQPQGEESNYPPENISYVAYRLRFRGFGPRGGSSSSDGETIYLTSNRGNLDPNKGTVRKWYTQNQSQVNNEPDKYTTSKSEAFVPFRIHFRLGFVCEGSGSYRILYSDHYHDWYNFEYKDIDFDSQELARQNNLPRDGDKLIFPDFSTENYIKPRIFEIKSDIYNLDLNSLNESKNRINMFAEATRDDTKARESNFLEFGKYIIT